MAKALINMLRNFLGKKDALCIGVAKSIPQFVASRLSQWRRQGESVIYVAGGHLPGDAEFASFHAETHAFAMAEMRDTFGATLVC
jgi:nicotinamidase-related amidase